MQTALVCEADLGIRGLIEVLLRQSGLQVETVSTGGDALERILSNDYGVIILDVMLPRLSGEAIVAAVADQSPLKLRRMIVTTSSLPDTRRSDAFSRVAAVMLKPFDIELLRETARTVASCSI